MEGNFIITGSIVHSESFDQITIIENGFVAVVNGKIVEVGEKANLAATKSKLNISDGSVIPLLKTQFLMPGLIDTHIHAPQYPNAGLGYDKPLLEWLDTYTFPLETKYAETKFAQKVYSTIVKRTVDNGTTTACYYATIHLASSLVLADAIQSIGQRAFVGKVNMNQNHPDYYGETTAASLADTEKFVIAVKERNDPLVQPIITPRFAISCDMPLMKSLGALAAKLDVHIQTHISESLDEIEFVHQLYPECANYVDVYDQAKLLTNKTVLAHGVHLLDEELQVLALRGTSVSHCASSNTCLRSGMCDVRRLLAAGVPVGLGTDVSGGPSASILTAIRAALDVSTHISFSQDEQYQPLNYHNMFYLATIGGAQALALGDKIGNFVSGKEFDALVVSVQAEGSPIELLGDFTVSELVQKFIYLGDDRNITQVFVSGKLVKNNSLSLATFSQFKEKHVTLLSQ